MKLVNCVKIFAMCERQLVSIVELFFLDFEVGIDTQVATFFGTFEVGVCAANCIFLAFESGLLVGMLQPFCVLP